MRTVREIRSVEPEQLAAEARQLRKTLFELRNKAVRGKPEKTHEQGQTRRELARVLTVMNERTRAAAKAAAAPQG